jgi:hypothetical protein
VLGDVAIEGGIPREHPLAQLHGLPGAIEMVDAESRERK